MIEGMKILVVYDSLFGNTKRVAEVVADALGRTQKVRLIATSEAKIEDLGKADLLVVGSPTQGGRAKKEMQKFLGKIPDGGLGGVKVAAFDTRILDKEQKAAVRLLMRTIGYAAPKIVKVLEKKGGKAVVSPEGFIVEGKEGPLAKGEVERARNWAEDMILHC